MMIPPAQLAALDQARAWCDEELTANVARFRELAADTGESQAVLHAAIELAAWSPRQLGSMLAVAIARLAQG